MVRGRKPLASAIKEASGAFIKDPQRRNKNEPKAKRGWPDIPDTIKADKDALERWMLLCEHLDSLNVLTIPDVFVLESQCIKWSMYVKLKAIVDQEGFVMVTEGKKTPLPEMKLMLELGREIDKGLSVLGLTPSDRSRLKVTQVKEENPFETWLNSDKVDINSDN